MNIFSAKHVCEILGITYRQLDYLDRKQVISPSVVKAQGSGSNRIYSIADLRQLKVIKELRDMGISLQKIRKCLVALKGFFPSLEYPLIEKQVFTDGKTVYIMTENPEISLDLLSKRGQLALFIPMKAWMEELKGLIQLFEEKLEKGRKKKARQQDRIEGLKPAMSAEISKMIRNKRTRNKSNPYSE